MNWALVIGVDEYWSEEAHLRGAVGDALHMRDWLLDPNGGNVGAEQLTLLLSPRPDAEAPQLEYKKATKDNLMLAIDALVQLSGGQGDRLFFYFAGHGLTARVLNRDESALVTTGFNSVNTDHSVALRSLWEFFETTQFADQFFFVDACRNIPPWETKEFEIGRWTLPRSRDPGQPPVQQFILYATSPGLESEEVRDEPGNEHGAFTAALMAGLGGAATAKTWSWENECYEVPWDRLADYVRRRVESEQHAGGWTAEGAPIPQVPQESGSRGVAGRDRNPCLAIAPAGSCTPLRLEVELLPDPVYEKAEVLVLDAAGATVAEAVKLTGSHVTFELPPKTYALRAAAPNFEEGLLKAPVDLYEPQPAQTLELRSLDAAALGADGAGPAEVVKPPAPPRVLLEASDPLTAVEIRDDAGVLKVVWRAGEDQPTLKPGFYRLSLAGPEVSSPEQTISLTPGEKEHVPLAADPLPPLVTELRDAAGGAAGAGETVIFDGLDPIAWATPATLVALGIGGAIHGLEAPALGLALPPRPQQGESSGIGVYVVGAASGDGTDDLASSVRVRVWRSAKAVPPPLPLQSVRPGLLQHVAAVEPGPWWVSIDRGEETPPVFSLAVLRRRLTALVVQVEPDGLTTYQYMPPLDAVAASEPASLRRLEFLQRTILGGRVDQAAQLVDDIAENAADDPFAGCLAGYALLKLRKLKKLREVVDAVIEVAPELADPYILRGEHASATGDVNSRQSFADAIAAMQLPIFAEGLTLLVEGLRAYDLLHPRATIVRYLFQQHVRGSMWAMCTPRRWEEGTLVVMGADTGFEA